MSESIMMMSECLKSGVINENYRMEEMVMRWTETNDSYGYERRHSFVCVIIPENYSCIPF